jgi:hypothetical protein
MNDFHYDSPTFCNRDPTEIVANVMQRANPGAFYERRSSSGSLAKFAALRRASSRVSRLVAERR